MNDLIIPGILYVQIGNEIQKIGETVDAPTTNWQMILFLMT